MRLAADSAFLATLLPVRDGINIARFVMKLKNVENGLTLSAHSDERFLMRTAILETLGDEALRYVPRP